jgi:DNA repair photolyase
MRVSETRVRGILTRSSGFLRSVCSHSLQPYRGCSFGQALCGVGCYAQHNRWLARGEAWGSFLEARVNSAETYLAEHAAEARWARRARGGFVIFMSSSTDPFVPQEERLGVTSAVLAAMLERPPDGLIVQTHTDRVLRARDALVALARRCELRVHLSIESDRDRLPGLPPPACSVDARLAAAAALRAAGLRVVITVSPLLPIARPEEFFARLGEVADAVVIDHFIEGDGTPDGGRTRRTALPEAMAAMEAASVSLEYRERMVAVARSVLPGRVGVSVDGFAGRLLDT